MFNQNTDHSAEVVNPYIRKVGNNLYHVDELNPVKNPKNPLKWNDQRRDKEVMDNFKNLAWMQYGEATRTINPAPGLSGTVLEPTLPNTIVPNYHPGTIAVQPAAGLVTYGARNNFNLVPAQPLGYPTPTGNNGTVAGPATQTLTTMPYNFARSAQHHGGQVAPNQPMMALGALPPAQAQTVTAAPAAPLALGAPPAAAFGSF